MTGSPLSRSAHDRLGAGREVILVDAVRDHAPGELREVVVERLDADIRDDDVAVQPAERGPRGRVHEIAYAPGGEDGVIRADTDRARGQHERGEHEEARVVGRVDVDDVELPGGEEATQLARTEREHCVQRLGAVAVERQRGSHVHELDVVGGDHAIVAVGGARDVGEPPGHDRHLVASSGEVHRLAVDVLRDAPELGVVVVRENADAHVPGCDQSAKPASYPTDASRTWTSRSASP